MTSGRSPTPRLAVAGAAQDGRAPTTGSAPQRPASPELPRDGGSALVPRRRPVCQVDHPPRTPHRPRPRPSRSSHAPLRAPERPRPPSPARPPPPTNRGSGLKHGPPCLHHQICHRAAVLTQFSFSQHVLFFRTHRSLTEMDSKRKQII